MQHTIPFFFVFEWLGIVAVSNNVLQYYCRQIIIIHQVPHKQTDTDSSFFVCTRTFFEAKTDDENKNHCINLCKLYLILQMQKSAKRLSVLSRH